MKLYGFLIVLLLGLGQAQAKTILISDIDDSIKNSHVLSTTDSLFNAGKIQNLVLGMNALYEAVSHTEPDMKFYYVTNAPKSFMETNHRDFLAYNRFPRGSLRLRESLFQSDFKVTEIRKILKAEKPEFAILVGDNGEKDVYVYEQIAKEFPNTLFLTYIRIAYSTWSSSEKGVAIRPGQTGFVTALDLMLQLRHEGFVNSADATNFVSDFVTVYTTEVETNVDGKQAFPGWSDCRDFKWTAPDSEARLNPGYIAVKGRIEERCTIAPFEY